MTERFLDVSNRLETKLGFWILYKYDYYHILQKFRFQISTKIEISRLYQKFIKDAKMYIISF